MPRLSARIPKYRFHKASGQAVVTLDGKDFYLGKHGTTESQNRYHEEVVQWQLKRRLPEQLVGNRSALTINELFVAYWEFVQVHYRKNGSPTSEVEDIRLSVREVLDLHGCTIVDEFGPLRLKAVRQAMIDGGLSRGVINQRIGRIKRLFKWGVENELVRGETLHALQAVAGLRKGRTDAREADPIEPADERIVERVRNVCSHQIAAMIKLQIATGMRPGEVVLLRPCDVERSGRVWVYEPSVHKTEHHGKRRRIYIGPKAQAALTPFLDSRSPFTFCFSPAEAEAERRARLSEHRRTPQSCGNRPGTNRKRAPKKQPRDRYDTNSYRRAIDYACRKAFQPPKCLNEQGLKAWRKAHRFHPHQLRHNAATFLAKEFGIEAAQVVLGHSSLAVTQVYAERDYAKAAAIMGEVG